MLALLKARPARQRVALALVALLLLVRNWHWLRRQLRRRGRADANYPELPAHPKREEEAAEAAEEQRLIRMQSSGDVSGLADDAGAGAGEETMAEGAEGEEEEEEGDEAAEGEEDAGFTDDEEEEEEDDDDDDQGDGEQDRRVRRFLRSMPHVSGLDPEALRFVYANLERVTLTQREVLFREGDACDDGMYIVIRGELAVERSRGALRASFLAFDEEHADDTDDAPLRLATLTRGMTIGENSLLEGAEARRRVSCVARTPRVVLLRLSADLFHSLTREHPRCVATWVGTTTARQWRVAHFALVDFLGMPAQRRLAREDEAPLRVPEVVAAALGALPGCEEERLPAGTVLFDAGEPAQEVWVPVRGALALYEQSPDGEVEFVRRVEPGGVAGGTACVVGLQHLQLCRAAEDSVAVRVPLEALLAPATAAGAGDGDELDARLALLLEVARHLSQLLGSFLALGLQRVWARTGKLVMAKGAAAEALFVVISGRLRLRAAAAGGGAGPGPAGEVGRGQCAGEVGVLLNGSYQQSAFAVRDSELVCVSQAAFDTVIRHHPWAMGRFTRRMARAAAESEAEQGRKLNLATVALVPAGGGGDPARRLGEFAERLSAALRAHGPTALLTSALAPMGARMRSVYERSQVAAWLSELEEDHRFVVLLADAEPSAWTRCCLRQADCILLVGDPVGATPELSAVERLQASLLLLGRRELVLLHADASRAPTNTRRWFHRRRIRGHHHIRLAARHGDFARLARHLAGQSVGVVLGGGGSRGLAHLGVIRALVENDVPIDYIAGTSQGAFMAACYAMTTSVQGMEAAVQRFCRRMGSLWQLIGDATLPILSYFSGAGFNETIRAALPADVNIEDLWLPYYCVTTDLTNGDLAVHDSGAAWRYARASMSVLGLVPPMVDGNGRVLADGGYANNLSVDVMLQADSPPAIVFAVDVENKDNPLAGVAQYGDSLSGWWLLAQWVFGLLGGRPMRLPQFAELTMSAAYIAHRRTLRALLEHGINDDTIVYLQPDVQRFKLLDYHKLAELADIGFAHAAERLHAWKARRQREADEKHETQAMLEMRRTASLSALGVAVHARLGGGGVGAGLAGGGVGAGGGAVVVRRSPSATRPLSQLVG